MLVNIEKIEAFIESFAEDGMWIGDVEVDINPISEEKTGTLSEYFPGVEAYLEKKKTAEKNICKGNN